MATAGNASDFGDLTGTRNKPALCDATRMVNFGGYNATDKYYHRDCDYLTIASAGNGRFWRLNKTISVSQFSGVGSRFN